MSEISTIPAGGGWKELCPDVGGSMLNLHGWGLLDAGLAGGWSWPVSLSFLTQPPEEGGTGRTGTGWVCDGMRDQNVKASTGSSWRLLRITFDSLWEAEDYCEVWMRKNMSGEKKKCCFAGIPSGDLEDFVLEKTLYSGLQLKWKEIHKEG